MVDAMQHKAGALGFDAEFAHHIAARAFGHDDQRIKLARHFDLHVEE